jgi:hypothetical protein
MIDDDRRWRRGLPPNMNVDVWEVYYTPGGIIWHRPKQQEQAANK